MSGHRLPAPYGSLINREERVTFLFEGKTYQGFTGDTIASALLANNQWLLSRSFKYHRPRGPLSMAGQDANTLVHLPSDPNTLADRQQIHQDLVVMGQNYSGSLERDRGAWLGLFSRFLPVGFYYKAFYKPRGIWQRWAPLVRKKAGLGVLDEQFEPPSYDKQYLFYDIAIVGGGPAGMAAALEAAKSGAHILLVEENASLGGSLSYARFDATNGRGAGLLEQMRQEIETTANLDVFCSAICNGWYADNWLAVIRDKRLYKVRTAQTIMCVGSLEQQAVFRNNDLPGVLFSSAAQRMIRLYGVRPGYAAVVLTGNNEGYATALDLVEAGVEVRAIVDMRSQPQYNGVARAAVAAGIPVKTGHTVYEAHLAAGKNKLGAVELRRIRARGDCEGSPESISCDLLCMAVGYTPTYQLICQAGAKLSYDDDSAAFTLTELPAAYQIAGSVNGHWDLDSVIADARRAAIIASNALDDAGGITLRDVPPVPSKADFDSPNFDWPIFPHPDGKEFVDFDEDLQIADILNATADGYEHIQLVKRYSTCGMGPSQGRHSALAAARLVADATGKTVAQTGVTTARPPFAPERLGHSAGRSFYPSRKSNMHYRHIEAGAQMLQAGAWDRPAYYGPSDRRTESILEEVVSVRGNVGLIDVSTLGGLEIRGPDAAEFLNRFYTFAFVKQPVGRARYALLTNEAGVVIDDGVACRLTDQHFYVTATTGGADRVAQSMLKWNAQWCLDCDIANVTSAWCAVNIAGPRSREVLQSQCTDVDLSADAFPYMSLREGTVAGIPARLLRVGFVGELGYEIHIPHMYGEALWDALMDAGKSFDIKPFGVEAQRVLRLEKAHIIVGQDTDAMTNPMEVQMNWAIARKKPFFVGARSITELEQTPLERTLVGFVINDPAAAAPKESQLILNGEKMVGRVTSCSYSPSLEKNIGLAYVSPSQAEPGTQLCIKTDGGIRVVAEVVATPFYDPETLRQEF